VFERVKDEWVADHPGEELTFPNPELWSAFRDTLEAITLQARQSQAAGTAETEGE